MAAAGAGGDAATRQLKAPPSDGVSAVRFQTDSGNLLAVSSWDTSVSIHDGSSGEKVAAYNHQAPALDCCFASQGRVFSGGLDKTVRLYDVQGRTERTLGSHENAVKCVEFSEQLNAAVTASWDSTLRVWDARAPTALQQTVKLPERAYGMSLFPSGTQALVATAQRRVAVVDLRAGSLENRESHLKHQTRAIAAFPDGSGFAATSIEGRCAVEYLTEEKAAKTYSFKCHRVKNSNKPDIAFPVNALAFHQRGTFATGGADGLVCFWDGENKKRIACMPAFPTSVSSLDFNHDCSLLAIGVSYTYERGEADHPADQVVIHQVADSEVAPKPRA